MRIAPPARRKGGGAGDFALAFGIIAVVCVFIPAIGDLLALPAAVLAIILGFIGVRRHETGRASRVFPAVIGTVLGAVASLIVGLIFAATHLQP